MEIDEIYKKLEGVQTIESVMSILNVKKEKAISIIHLLRKGGYVKTQRLSNNKRVYNISFSNKFRGEDYYEIINKHSPIKISKPNNYKIYDKFVSLEETLIFSLKTKKIRIILASLSLFSKINDWKLLYKLAKENKLERKVGALYDLSRNIMKTKRMDKRIRKHMLPEKEDKYQHIIEGFESKDYKDIERKWKVYLPFNKNDLEDYK